MYFQLHNIFFENNYFLPNLGGKNEQTNKQKNNLQIT